MRIVLIGDSIRLGYQPVVARLLEGFAAVVGPTENCRSTADILEHFDAWVTDLLAPRSVVHLNAGLHDLRRLEGPETDAHVAIDAYEASLRRIVQLVLADERCERLIVATTTPVDDERHTSGRCAERHDADVQRYNMRLRRVAASSGVELHELGAAIRADAQRFLGDDGVHLTPAGNEAAARSLATVVTGGRAWWPSTD